MINVNSYYNDSNEAAGILNTLDAHETDAQFEDRKEKNRLLHICKEKGFPRLEALGAKCGGIERSTSKLVANDEQVKQAWENILNGSTRKEEANKLGITLGAMGSRLIKHGFTNKKLWEHRIPKILELLEQGETVKGAARKMGFDVSTVKYQLKQHKKCQQT